MNIIIEGIEYIPKENKEKIIQETTAKTIEWGKSSEDTMNWNEAKEWCKKQGGRLPTRLELLQAYVDKVKGFETDAYYWSSTEYYTNYAWTQSFDTGVQSYYNKFHYSYVRCVIG